MRKVIAILTMVLAFTAINAQSYEFESKSYKWNDDSEKVSDVWFMIKDGAWISDGKNHVILMDSFDKRVSEKGNVFFYAEGIDKDGDECAISILPDAKNDGSDGVLFFWSTELSIWYFGKLKLVE